MKTVSLLGSSAFTNAFTASICRVSRSNLAIVANRVRKEVAANVVARVGRSHLLY